MRYEGYIKVMYRIDNIKKEIEQYETLLRNLVEEDEYSPTHYAAHKETGLIYDKRIIGDNLTRLNDEMTNLEETLNSDQ